MTDKTLDDVILEAVRPLSEEQKQQLLAYIEQMENRAAAPTRAELWSLPYEERNHRIKLALEQSQVYDHDDLEGYTEADFDDGAAE